MKNETTEKKLTKREKEPLSEILDDQKTIFKKNEVLMIPILKMHEAANEKRLPIISTKELMFTLGIFFFFF